MEAKVAGTKKFKEFIFAVGRRKSAVARVRVYSKVSDTLKYKDYDVKKGDIVVNGIIAKEYFTLPSSNLVVEGPLKVTGSLNKYAVTARVVGGGLKSQMDAVVLGIARALSAIDEENRALLRKSGLLTRDSRVRERRKVGMGGKSRRKRQSPKR